MVRWLIDEFREIPATMIFCSLWILVFALMVLNQVAQGHVPTKDELVLGVRGGHPFGELTVNALLQGEIWLPLTATFVHYGLLHLGMNLFIMYQLGAVVETWYGPWQLLAVYVATGYGGNLLSALARYSLGSNPRVASGGGSTVILGLVALCAVVGWRSRTRIGTVLRSQMVWLLAATALLGLIVPIIDNWGHAGGALVGALIGFTHRILIRTAQRPVAKWVGGLGVLLLLASGAAQVREDQRESALAAAEGRKNTTEQTTRILARLNAFYPMAARRSWFEHAPGSTEADRRRPWEMVPRATLSNSLVVKPLWLLDSSDEDFRAELRQYLELLDTLRDDLGTAPTDADFQRLRTLFAQVLDMPPSQRIKNEFFGRWNVLNRRAQQDRESARAEWESLRHQSRLGWGLSRPARSPIGRPAGAGDVPSAVARPR